MLCGRPDDILNGCMAATGSSDSRCYNRNRSFATGTGTELGDDRH